MAFGTTASLVVMRKEDFSRVLNFVKPDEHDEEPHADEEYEQVWDYVDMLPGEERVAWMIRHCKRLYVDFRAKEDKQENMEELKQRRRARVQEMIDLGSPRL